MSPKFLQISVFHIRIQNVLNLVKMGGKVDRAQLVPSNSFHGLARERGIIVPTVILGGNQMMYGKADAQYLDIKTVS